MSRRKAIKIEAKRDLPREFRVIGDGAARIQAARNAELLPTFDGEAYTGAPMRPEGWWQPVIIDLRGVKIPSQHRPVLRQHDHEQIAGHTTMVKADKDGIHAAGVFSGQSEHVEKITIPAKNGFQWQLSVGANPIRTEFLEAGETTTVNGREVTGPLTISRETEVGEISFVPLGADGATSARVAATRGDIMNPFQAALAQLAADGNVKAAKYTKAEIDEMSADKAKAALKECMKNAKDEEDDDDEEDEEDEEEDAKKKSKSSRRTELQAQADEVMKSLRANAAKEHVRQSAIAAVCRQHNVADCEIDDKGKRKKVNLCAHAIENDWTAEQAELAAIKAARPGAGVGIPGGLGYTTSSPEMSETVLECAVLQAGRHEFRLDDDAFYFSEVYGSKVRRVPEYVQRDAQRDLKARYTDQVQQAAHSLFHGRVGLQQLLTCAARLNGYTGSDRVDDANGSEVLRFAAGSRFGGMGRTQIAAEGVSTASIANILANVLNKFMLQGYLFVEQAWREICAIRPVNDFKPTKSINLLGDTTFKQVAPTGELKDASLSDQAFANQADQYGRILTINRKNIINDDLGILTTTPMKVGQGGGLALNNLFWSVFLNLASPANTTGLVADDGNYFFNASSGTHGAAPNFQAAAGANYFSGGGSALASASLQTAKQLFDKQVDPNGNPLGFDGLVPILLFPPELWITAIELVDPSAIGLVYGGASAAKQPNINLWKGRLKPVMSRYLSNSTFPGYVAGASTTAFYVLFAPVALAAIEACFLNGIDVPTVQMASQDFQFDRLGMSLRGIMDFGVTQQNFRAAVKSAGA